MVDSDRTIYSGNPPLRLVTVTWAGNGIKEQKTLYTQDSDQIMATASE